MSQRTWPRQWTASSRITSRECALARPPPQKLRGRRGFSAIRVLGNLVHIMAVRAVARRRAATFAPTALGEEHTPMGLPERQGLYDPRNEHDACGVGFVANIKGRKSHDIIAPGAADPGQPRPSRRGRRRPAGRRRRRLPDPDPRRAAARLGRAARARPAAARRLRGGDVLPAAGRRGARRSPSSSSSTSSQVEGQTLLGWRDVPTDTDRPRQGGASRRCR